MSKRKKHVLPAIIILIVAGAVAHNLVAYMHAYRMTHFVTDGEKTPKPEALSTPRKLKVLLTGVRVPKPDSKSKPSDYGLEYADVSFASADGIQLAAWNIPADNAAGTVVLLHGYASCKAHVIPEAVLWHELGWNVLPVDFRGSGGSDGFATTLGWKEAMDIAAANKWVGEQRPDDTVILAGASMGAAAIVKAIDDGLVEPDGVVLECPFDNMLTTIKHRFEVMGVPSFPSAQLLVFWGGVQHDFNGFKHNPSDYAASVTCPALVLHGRNDPRVELPEAEAVETAIAGPSSIHVFEEIAHESYCQASPEEYQRVVTNWLAESGLRTE